MTATRERQPREHTVPCRRCHRPTWDLDAECADCRARDYRADLRAEWDACPVHEHGDPDCSPTFGAPCIGVAS